MKRGHRRAHVMVWLLLTPVVLLVLALAILGGHP